MKKQITIALLLISVYAKSQVGVGTTSPNSTLDVRGSMSLNYRAFSSATSAATTDNILMFTGTSAAALTLPDATTCPGRVYTIKNVSSNSSVLSIATTSSQTIDGLSSWSLTQMHKALVVVSNGTGWYATSESLPGNSAGTPWVYGGNNVSSMQNIGTTSNHHLPFITNNTEKMRLTSTGNLGIGTSTFDGTNPEKLLVDAGTTSSFNVISGKGSINNYLQLNIQNRNTGNAASSDIVATADNGNETVNFVDLGINSSNYSNSGVLGGANRAYLYSTGNDFAIGNSTAAKDLLFFTGGTASTNERMRIDANGNVGIGGLAVIPKGSIGMAKLAIEGTNSSSSGPHVQFTSSSDNYPLMQILPWSHDNVSLSFDAYWDGSNWKSSSSTGGNFQFFKNADKLAIRYADETQGTTISTFNNGIVLNVNGNAAVGTGTWDGTNPEKFLVDAGTTSSFNVISGKGSINNYLQLNIQNRNNGGAASSDIVASADNGTESVNFVDLGINSSGYSSSGVLGGANRAYLYATGQDFAIGNATSAKDLIFFTGGTAVGNERMRITSTSVYPGQDNVYTMGKNGNRWSQVWSANGTIQTSDIRTKKNIHNLRYGLNEVMQMNPVAYNWKDDPSNSNKIGLIAQEVRSLVPEVVIGNEKTETLGMNYAELVPVLVKAIQEQQQQIEQLKKEVKELKRKP